MDQYHLNDTLDYAGNMINSTHHLMNQHQLQPHQQQTNQPQYTQLHASGQHHNLNNNVMNNLNNNVTNLMNGQQKTNGTTNAHNTHNGQVQNNNNSNTNGNANLNGQHNGNAHNNQQTVNGNNHTNNHGNNQHGPNTAIIHPTNVRHTNAQQQQHLNQQLLQLNNASPPQHQQQQQQQSIQHAQLTHDHLHSLDNSPQLTNLTNSTSENTKYETKYTPPNQSMKRKLDDYLDPQMTNDNLLNEDESPMKKIAQTNGKKTKGRVKIKMEFIDNKLRRYTTFSKRKTGIMKKAYELSTLTGTQVMLLVASETGHVYTFATRKLQPMITSEAGKALIQTCLNSPDAPNNGLDQRMSATGFEETDLSYSIHDDSSEKDEGSSSSSETYLQNEELPYKLNEHGKLIEDDFEKDDKSFMNLDSRLNLQQRADQFASSGRQQQRKSRKPAKALQLDNLANVATSSSSSNKKMRSQSNYISQQFNSPHSSSSSASNSPSGSPASNLFQNSSLGLGNLTNSVNNSLNSTNRNLDHLNNLNNLNTSQSILPITFIQNALDNYKNSGTILPTGSTASLPLNQNLINNPVMNKQFNLKSNKSNQQNQQTAQLSTLINTSNLLFYPSSTNPPTTLMYQASQNVVCANNSNVFGDNLVLNSTTSNSANNFDNQFNQHPNFNSSSSSMQFNKLNQDRKNVKKLKFNRK